MQNASRNMVKTTFEFYEVVGVGQNWVPVGGQSDSIRMEVMVLDNGLGLLVFCQNQRSRSIQETKDAISRCPSKPAGYRDICGQVKMSSMTLP